MAWNPALEDAGGGIATTSSDLVRWGRALYGGRALPGDYLPELLRSVPLDSAGATGIRRFLSRLLLWRAPAAWWAFLLLGIPAVFYAGAAYAGRLDGLFPFDAVGPALGAMAFMVVLGPVEEFGWRGFALPLLQRRFSPLWAGLILGLIWGLWHLPAFFLSGTPQSGWGFTPFLAGSIALSVIVTPLFNVSRGSILLAGFYHYQMINPLWPDAQPYDTTILIPVAAAIVWLNRETMLRRDGGVTEITRQTANE